MRGDLMYVVAGKHHIYFFKTRKFFHVESFSEGVQALATDFPIENFMVPTMTEAGWYLEEAKLLAKKENKRDGTLFTVGGLKVREVYIIP